MEFHECFKNLMKEKGVSAGKIWADFAECGMPITPQTIVHWQTGKCLPKSKCLPLIAKALGVTIGALFGEE